MMHQLTWGCEAAWQNPLECADRDLKRKSCIDTMHTVDMREHVSHLCPVCLQVYRISDCTKHGLVVSVPMEECTCTCSFLRGVLMVEGTVVRQSCILFTWIHHEGRLLCMYCSCSCGDMHVYFSQDRCYADQNMLWGQTAVHTTLF